MLFNSIAKNRLLLKRRDASAVEILEKTLAQIKLTSEFNSFISIKNDLEFPEEIGDEELHGITFAAKDNFCTTDFLTTCASKMLKNYKPPYNATVVNKLLYKGATLVGKTNLDEFAMGSGGVDSCFGPVKNPWTLNTNSIEKFNDWHIAGGSSSGSACAVASGACTFALGTDTGGSVRNPAALCGVVGLKPTYGLLSRHGLISLVNSMDVPGILARNVDDVEIVLKILAGHDPLDSTTHQGNNELKTSFSTVDITGVNIGVPKEFEVPELSKEVSTVWRYIADMLQNNGANVESVSLPHSLLSVPCYSVLCAAEVMSNKARYDGLRYGHRSDNTESTNAMFAIARKDALCDVVRSRILLGSYFLLRENKEKYYDKALKVRRLIKNDFENVFCKSAPFKADILITPVVLNDAPLYKEFMKVDNRTRCTENDIFTQPSNLAGVPSVTIPICLSKNGLPLGLQIIGPNFSDLNILQMGKFIEEKVKFPTLWKLFEDFHFDAISVES